MNIFSDYHHDSLITSLYRLFEGRLGHNLYRPIGMDWFSEGFWAINDQEDTARQYLEIGSDPKDKTRKLNEPGGNGRNYMEIQGLGSTHKAITLDTFKNIKIDVVIASIPAHIEPFKRLIKEYQPHAKLVLQVGNEWNWQEMPVDNLLVSTAKRVKPEGKNVVFYHQEFDEKIFFPRFFPREKIISCFINVLEEKPQDYELFLELERLMPDWEFRMYGAQNRDGNITTLEQLAEAMSESRFIFHCKTGGDGFGHVLWNAAFCGVPLITRMADYRGKLGETIMSDMTSIFVDNKSPDMIVREIADKNSRAMAMGWNIYDVAKDECNFEEDAEDVREWLANLI